MSYEKMDSDERAKVSRILAEHRIASTGVDPSDRALAEYIQGNPLDSTERLAKRAETVHNLQATYNGRRVEYFTEQGVIRFIRPRNRADVARDLRLGKLRGDEDRFEAHLLLVDGTKKGGYLLSKLKMLD